MSQSTSAKDQQIVKSNNLISQTSYAEKEQTISITDLISEGPIEGLVDAEASIYLNDTRAVDINSVSFSSDGLGNNLSATVTTGSDQVILSTAFTITPSGGGELEALRNGRILTLTLGTSTISSISTAASVVEGEAAFSVTSVDPIFDSSWQNSFTNVSLFAYNSDGTIVSDYINAAIETITSSTQAKIILKINQIDADRFLEQTTGNIISISIYKSAYVILEGGNLATLATPWDIGTGSQTYTGSISGNLGVNGLNNNAITGFTAQFRPGRYFQSPITDFVGANSVNIPAGAGFSPITMEYNTVAILGGTSSSGFGLSSDQVQEIDKVRISFAYPSGLFATKTETGARVKAHASYSIKAQFTRGGNTSEVVLQSLRIHGGQNTSPIVFEELIDLEPFKPFSDFSIIVTRLSNHEGPKLNEDGISTNGKAEGSYPCSLATISASINEVFTYPYTAYANITFSTKEFTSPPVRTYHARGLKVKVPSNYTTREQSLSVGNGISVDDLYDGFWDGAFKEGKVYTNNPAWVFYDILTNTRYGLGDWVSLDDIDIYSLYRVARYCDELVPDGKGGLEPRFTANLYLTKATDAYKVLKDMATIFVGILYWLDGKITAVNDAPKDPIYSFSKSNVLDGFFSYESSGSKTRSNQIYVTWNDPEANYNQSTVLVEDRENIINTGRIIREDAVAFGCTSEGQAIRYGKWKLWTAVNQTEIVSFRASLDGAFLAPGDIIKIQDANRNALRYSGRIKSSTTPTTTSFRIDSSISLDVNSNYYISIVIPDTNIETGGDEEPNPIAVETREVVSVVGNLVTVAIPFSTAPTVGSIWALREEDKATGEIVAGSDKNYKILGIVEQSKNVYSISAVEHYNEKFTAIEQDFTLAVEERTIKTDDIIPAPPNVYLQKQSNPARRGDEFTILWDVPLSGENIPYEFIAGYELTHNIPGYSSPIQIKSTTNFYSFLNVPEGIYSVSVKTINTLGRKSLGTKLRINIDDPYELNVPRSSEGLGIGGASNCPVLIDNNKIIKFKPLNEVSTVISPIVNPTNKFEGSIIGFDASVFSSGSYEILFDSSEAELKAINYNSSPAHGVPYWYNATTASGSPENDFTLKSGTVTIPANSVVVTGTGTDFGNEYKIGDIIRFSNTKAAKVSSVFSSTGMVIDRSFSSSINSSLHYKNNLRINFNEDILVAKLNYSSGLPSLDSYMTVDNGLVSAVTLSESGLNRGVLISNPGGGIVIEKGGAVRAAGETSENITDGFYLGYNNVTDKNVFGVGDTTNYMIWDGADLRLSGELVAASGTFSGSLQAATGTFNGSIKIGSGENVFIADTNGIYLGNETFSSAEFRVTPAGALTATNATISGSISATTGTIGGFTVGSTDLTAGTGASRISLSTANGIHLGADAFASAPFRVSTAGALTATGATISGSITASSGTIGGFTVGNTDLTAGDGTTKVSLSTTAGIHLGANTFASAPFSVSQAGSLKATSGTVGGFTLGTTDLTAGTGTSKVSLSTTAGIHLGANAFADAPFSVSQAGSLKATSGTVGGFTLGTTDLTAGDATTKVSLSTSSGIHLGANAFADAPFSVSPAGALKATSANITGDLTAVNLRYEEGAQVFGQSIQLYSSLVFTPNILTGSSNVGEITIDPGRIKYNTIARELTAVNYILTPFENNIAAPEGFYIIWGEGKSWGTAAEVSEGSARFATADSNTLNTTTNNSILSGIFVAIYDTATSQWKAVDNANTRVDFSLLPTDIQIAFGRKTTTDTNTGIDILDRLGVFTSDPFSLDTTQTLIAGTTINDGGITLSNGGVIKSDGTNFNTDSVTPNGTSGFYLGYASDTDGVGNDNSGYRFFVGNPGSSSLLWNGSNLSVKGNITAESLRLESGIRVSGIQQYMLTAPAVNDWTVNPASTQQVFGNYDTVFTGLDENEPIATWTTAVYTNKGISGGVSATFRVDTTDSRYMAGLCFDATPSTSFTDIDFAVFVRGNIGDYRIYENGSLITTLDISTYPVTSGDVWIIYFNGDTAYYILNGEVVHTTTPGNRLTAPARFKVAVDGIGEAHFTNLLEVIFTGIATDKSTVDSIQNTVTISDGGIVISDGGAVKTLGTGFDTDAMTPTGTAGFYLGYVEDTDGTTPDNSGYKFFIGNPSTESMLWDGTDLSITGKLTANTLDITNATVSGTLSVANLNIDGTTITNNGSGAAQVGTIGSDNISVTSIAAINSDLGAITAGSLKGGTVPDADAAPSDQESGSFFDLDNGKFVVGNATNNILFDGTNLTVAGDITADNLTFDGANVTGTLSAANIEVDEVFNIGTINTDLAVGGLLYNFKGFKQNQTFAKLDYTNPSVTLLPLEDDTVSSIVTESDTRYGNSYYATDIGSGVTLLSDAEADAIESGDFSYSVWFKSTTTTGDSTARVLTRDASDFWAIAVAQNQTGNQNVIFYSAPSSQSFDGAPVNEWNHVVLTRSGTTVKGYLNGREVTTYSSYSTAISDRPVVLGTNTEDVINLLADSFIGHIADVKVYEKALSLLEVQSLYLDPTGQGKANIDAGTIGGVTITPVSLYEGAGNFNNADTGFYLDNTGNFSLEDKLSFNSSTSTLSIDGDIVARDLNIENAIITGSLGAANISVLDLSSLSADLGSITAGDINIGSGTFTVDSSGNLTATSATITGDITAENLDVTNATISGKITAPNLIAANNGRALNVDPLVKDATAWFAATSEVLEGGTYSDTATFTTVANGKVGKNVLRSPTGADYTTGAVYTTEFIPVSEDRDYVFSLFARESSTAPGGDTYFGVAFYSDDAAGGYLDTYYVKDLVPGTDAGINLTSTFGKYEVRFGVNNEVDDPTTLGGDENTLEETISLYNTAPSGTLFAKLVLFLNVGDSTSASNYVEVQDVRLEEGLPVEAASFTFDRSVADTYTGLPIVYNLNLDETLTSSVTHTAQSISIDSSSNSTDNSANLNLYGINSKIYIRDSANSVVGMSNIIETRTTGGIPRVGTNKSILSGIGFNNVVNLIANNTNSLYGINNVAKVERGGDPNLVMYGIRTVVGTDVEPGIVPDQVRGNGTIYGATVGAYGGAVVYGSLIGASGERTYGLDVSSTSNGESTGISISISGENPELITQTPNINKAIEIKNADVSNLNKYVYGIYCNLDIEHYLSGGLNLGGASLNKGTSGNSTSLEVLGPIEIASFDAKNYSGGKFIISAKESRVYEKRSHICELLVSNDETTVVATQYGSVYTDKELATYEVDILNGRVRILATQIEFSDDNPLLYPSRSVSYAVSETLMKVPYKYYDDTAKPPTVNYNYPHN